MARLPVPGGDVDAWGNVLNEFLSQSHNIDGSIKNSAVRGLQGRPVSSAPPGSGDVLTYDSGTGEWIPQVSGGVQDASSTQKGVVQLTNDLGGTATNPTVVATHLSAPLPVDQGGTGSATQNFVDLTSAQTIGGAKTFSSAPNVPDGSFTQAKVQNLTSDLAAKANAVDLTNHISDTTDVHGIADTSVLETQAGAQQKVDIHAANKNLHGAERVLIPAVRRFRAEAARARAGGLSTTTVWLGDSLTEAYTPSKRGFIWPLHLSRRLNGPRQTRIEYIPSSASTFCSLNAADWPGGQIPWTYSGASGTIAYGPDMHGVNIGAGGFVELPYFGDIVTIRYTRTPAAPAGGCPVTFDGAVVGSLNANGTLLPGQGAAFGNIGEYGAHTIRINVPSGTLSLEGAIVYDGTGWGFGLNFSGVGVVVAGHAGFATTHFTDAGATNWAPSVASFAPSLVGIALGANDVGAGRTADQYRDSMVAIMNRIDAAVDAFGGTRPGYLLVEMVGLPADYIMAAWAACDAVDTNRCAVLDLSTRINTTNWGVLDNGGHPGDSGQIWIADIIANAIDTADFRPPTTSTEGVFIEATSPATTRVTWAENLTTTPGVVPTIYDASPGGAAIGDRRHRIWLDPGTYQARATLSRGSSLGQCQILVGHTSLGTVDCYQAAADVNIFTLGATVTIDTPGWYPITIRKLATKNASSSDYVVRFHRLHLRKI